VYDSDLANLRKTDKQLGARVFERYGLTKDEIKIVEGNQHNHK
jgi:hypothetical protein